MYFVNHYYETDLYFNCDTVAYLVTNYLKYNPKTNLIVTVRRCKMNTV